MKNARIQSALALTLSFALPLVVGAQGFATDGRFTGYIRNILDFINNIVIPVIIALAILSFIWGIFKFFIWGAADEESRAQGQNIMIYSIIGLVLILSVQGIVNLFSGALGLEGGTIQPPRINVNI
jgi:hypothetical protein